MSLQPPVDNIAIRTCEEGDIAAIAVIYAYHVLHGLASFEIEPERSINVRTVSIAPSRGCA
jgi:L-amino acid N-acyltransferase YncA